MIFRSRAMAASNKETRRTMPSLPAKIRLAALNFIRLTLPAMVILVSALEILARVALPVSDCPTVTFHPFFGNHFTPNQQGTYIKGIDSEIKAAYSINSEGWNSPVEYAHSKPGGIFRIAVIGDSFVEALQVDIDKSYPYLMEKQLNRSSRNFAKKARPVRFQVYTFGHSGANLVQYLNVLRRISVTFKPDLIIVNITHNDFKESLYERGRIDYWSARQIADSFKEVPPTPTRGLRLRRSARNSALVRYLVINLSIQERIRYLYNASGLRARGYAANISGSDVDLFGDGLLLRDLLVYVFRNMKYIAEHADSAVLLIMDGNRQAIYRGESPYHSTPFRLNAAATNVAREIDIPIIDLTETFERNWADRRHPFDWKCDGHWNHHGHGVVANAVGHWIVNNSRSLGIAD